MKNTSEVNAAETREPEDERVDEAPDGLVSLAELQDRFRNFPAPQLQFRVLIKSVPGLAA
jgi:hypothetical protein